MIHMHALCHALHSTQQGLTVATMAADPFQTTTGSYLRIYTINVQADKDIWKQSHATFQKVSSPKVHLHVDTLDWGGDYQWLQTSTKQRTGVYITVHASCFFPRAACKRQLSCTVLCLLRGMLHALVPVSHKGARCASTSAGRVNFTRPTWGTYATCPFYGS